MGFDLNHLMLNNENLDTWWIGYRLLFLLNQPNNAAATGTFGIRGQIL